MDGLLSEISSKRKAISSDKERPTKYLRKGELDAIKRNEENALKEAKELEREEKRKAEEAERVKAEVGKLVRREKAKANKGNKVEEEKEKEVEEGIFNPPPLEITRRLRLKSQPIRLFGELDRDRRLRLRALEVMEERGHKGGHDQNDFRKALEGVSSVEKELMDEVLRNTEGKGKKEKEERGEELLELDWIKNEKGKLHPAIYYTLKRRLKEWGEAMDNRPEEIKRTTQGKLAAATQLQSSQNLSPLFRQLRTRTLPADMVAPLSEIVHYMQKRQYQKANDAYLRLSIGNAPWPIGVTMVGIHERSAREKISSDQVAHVLNDEVSRKYIQSLKRLLTFSQTLYPPDDRSQLMG